jgi:hypothetical protein
LKIFLAAVDNQVALKRILNEGEGPANILLSYYDLSGLSGIPFRKTLYKEMIEDGVLTKRNEKERT